jgi:hypothetical protein
MNRLIWTALVGGLLLAADATAQAPVPRPLGGASTPPVSPYINLLRGGNAPAMNYYGLVRPQVEFRNAVLGLQGQFWNAQQAASLQTGEGGTTGHPVSFLNYGGYFMTTTGGPIGTGGPTAPTRPALGGGFGMSRPLSR